MTVTTTLFVLPPDVTIVPVSTLTAALRKQLGADDDSFAIGRPRARSNSKLLDRAGVNLLDQFRSPATLPAAITAYCAEFGGDARTVATQSFPLLIACVNGGLLVPSDSELANAIVPTLDPGARIAGASILRCVSLSNDSEVYEVRDARGAHHILKIARGAQASAAGPKFTREASILRRLAGRGVSKLADAGTTDSRPFLMAEWLDGEHPDTAGARHRGESGIEGARALLRLAARIASAYASLHERRVIHGDVHHGNVMVSAKGAVSLLDFGAARTLSVARDRNSSRVGVAYYREPEWARALLANRREPATSAAGEQYAVAALLFQVFTGHQYVEFSLDEEAMLKQIVSDPPQTFADCGVRPWPEVERILAKALQKHPAKRFRSMRQMADALGGVKVNRERERTTSRSRGVSRYADRVIERLSVDGALFRDGFTTAPTASLQFGASGVALALSRIACVRDDPAQLALADLWNAKALRAIHSSDAFYCTKAGLTPSLLGKAALYHSRVGTMFVDAHVSHARGDVASREAAIAQFALAARETAAPIDIGTGIAGVLLASANLLPLAEPGGHAAAAIATLGRRTSKAIAARVTSLPPIEQNRRFVNLGILHGWGGVLHALLRWCNASGARPPSWTQRRLRELERLGTRDGRGVRWPWRDTFDAPAMSMAGWCNGSAGFAHLWTLAHSTFGDSRYLELAERCAWTAWQEPAEAWDLCCGTAGRSYALLNVYRHTGARSWLERAHLLAAKAVKGALKVEREKGMAYRHCLMRGVSGVAMLCEELSRPDEARMPVFES